MILGVGIDLVMVSDIQEQIETISGFLDEIFTKTEIEESRDRPNAYQCFAARFAAKEAFMKATGCGWTDAVDFHEIEVRSDGSSKPTLHLSAKASAAVDYLTPFAVYVSLTHTEAYASAVVILDR